MTETLLITGISGFIAKHIALCALNRGYALRGTLRSLSRADEVRAALRPHLTDPAALDRLGFIAADLGADVGWAEAMAGVSAVIHTASPFPITQPTDEMDLIGPARDGTLRVLRAAQGAGVNRVVLTSSVAAIGSLGRRGVQDESHWSDQPAPAPTAYARSKTMAERAAWEFAGQTGLALTTINPGLVTGPPLDQHFGTSLDVIARILRGRDPMLPDVYFATVDVRDVAEMHLRALERPGTVGKRYLALADGPSLSMLDMGRFFKARHPTRRIATRRAPNWVLRTLSLFDPSIRTILPEIGNCPVYSNRSATQDMGIRFVPATESLAATADRLQALGLLWH